MSPPSLTMEWHSWGQTQTNQGSLSPSLFSPVAWPALHTLTHFTRGLLPASHSQHQATSHCTVLKPYLNFAPSLIHHLYCTECKRGQVPKSGLRGPGSRGWGLEGVGWGAWMRGQRRGARDTESPHSDYATGLGCMGLDLFRLSEPSSQEALAIHKAPLG